MTTATKNPFEQLREPFPKDVVGILPKPYKRDSPKGKCNECGGYHGLPAAHLDYVGHAAVTDRLLTVDPMWTWEPMHRQIDSAALAAALASGSPECVRLLIENSPPALDRDGNLWIRLTVNGVTRPGVGDGPNMKERIGDALRNAAMRFGVALSLWSKDELESGYGEAKATDALPQSAEAARPRTTRAAPQADPETGEVVDSNLASQKQLGMIASLFGKKGFPDDRTIRHNYVAAVIGREFASTKELTKKEASAVIEALMAEEEEPAYDPTAAEAPF